MTEGSENWRKHNEDDAWQRNEENFWLCMLMATLLFGSAVAKADVVLDWNLIAVNTAIANGQSPFAQARYAAIIQLAVFEAVNAITRGLSAISWEHRRPPWRFSRRSSHPGCLSGAQYLFPAQRVHPRHCSRELAGFDTGRSSQE